MKRRSLKYLLFLMLLLSTSALMAPCAWAGGDASDGHSHGPGGEHVQETVLAPGATETEIELKIADLTSGAGGAEPPLEGAKITGFLKNGTTGELLSLITSEPGSSTGAYRMNFGGRDVFSFPAAGTYALELSITPKSGDPIDTTVELKLPTSAPPTAAPIQRVWPFLVGAVLLGLVALLLRKRKRPAATLAALLALLFLAPRVWAGGDASDGHSHGPSGEDIPKVAAPVGGSPGLQIGEVSSTSKAGPLRIVLTARTRVATPQALPPGQVQLPAETAMLLNIKTAAATVTTLTSGITFNGQIAPAPDAVVRVASVVPGRVVRLSVREGDNVRQGQVVAVVESRAIGEAQSAYRQALARLQNARAQQAVTQQQVKAGVYSRAPLDVARRAIAEANGEVRVRQAELAKARAAQENTLRLARAGSYASPAYEEAKRQTASAHEAVDDAELTLANAETSVEAGEAELKRRRELSQAGAYNSKPLEEARRTLTTAHAEISAAQSQLATAQAQLSRARILVQEGLVAKRDVETAQTAVESAESRLQTARADETAAQAEVERQQKLASTNVAGNAEIQAAQTTLQTARNQFSTATEEVKHKREAEELAESVLAREKRVLEQNLANRREISAARSAVEGAAAELIKARGAQRVTQELLAREQQLYSQRVNDTGPLQTARAATLAAQADVDAAGSTLALFKSAPGGSVSVPVRAPLSGVVQSREAAPGELVQADAPLLTIVNLSRVIVEAALFESDLPRVVPGAVVRVTIPALPGRSFSGRLSVVGSVVNPQTRTITARATLANPGALRPGMFARGLIETGQPKLALTVPAGAIVDDGAAKIVFVKRGARYERRAVRLGASSGNRVAILEGIKQGEDIVTQGGAALRAQAARGE